MKTPPVAKRGVMDMYVSLFFVPRLTSIKSVPCAGVRVRVHMCVCKVCKVCVTLYVEGGEGWENTSTFFVYTVPPPHSYTCPALTC